MFPLLTTTTTTFGGGAPAPRGRAIGFRRVAVRHAIAAPPPSVQKAIVAVQRRTTVQHAIARPAPSVTAAIAFAGSAPAGAPSGADDGAAARFGSSFSASPLGGGASGTSPVPDNSAPTPASVPFHAPASFGGGGGGGDDEVAPYSGEPGSAAPFVGDGGARGALASVPTVAWLVGGGIALGLAALLLRRGPSAAARIGKV